MKTNPTTAALAAALITSASVSFAESSYSYYTVSYFQFSDDIISQNLLFLGASREYDFSTGFAYGDLTLIRASGDIDDDVFGHANVGAAYRINPNVAIGAELGVSFDDTGDTQTDYALFGQYEGDMARAALVIFGSPDYGSNHFGSLLSEFTVSENMTLFAGANFSSTSGVNWIQFGGSYETGAYRISGGHGFDPNSADGYSNTNMLVGYDVSDDLNVALGYTRVGSDFYQNDHYSLTGTYEIKEGVNLEAFYSHATSGPIDMNSIGISISFERGNSAIVYREIMNSFNDNF